MWAGTSATLAQVRHLHGGTVSNTLALTLSDGSRAVLKVSPHRVDRALAREAQQLAHLRLLGVPVPAVYAWHLANLDDPHSYLLMEFCEGITLHTAKSRCTVPEYDDLQRDLARVVLLIHQHTGPAYMRVGGEVEHQHPPHSSWCSFFKSVYEPIWAEVDRNSHTTKTVRRHFSKIHDALPRLLAHEDAPRLVHWDLWSSNILVHPTPEGWRVSAILDPMCKYAHVEAELAYLELFHTVTPAFKKAYKAILRPSEAYAAIRREVYQLYFLMSHAALFGGAYHAQFAQAADRLFTAV